MTKTPRTTVSISAVDVAEYIAGGLFIAAVALTFGLIGGLFAGALVALALAELSWSGRRVRKDLTRSTDQVYEDRQYGDDKVWTIPLPHLPKRPHLPKFKKKSS